MKRLLIAISLLTATLFAQPAPAPGLSVAASPANGPSYSQMYCSGFITSEKLPRTNFVLGSKESPHEDRFPGRSQLFLGGPALKRGETYSIVRQVEDPNREDSSPEQRRKLARIGALYQEIGWVTVRAVENGVAVASFDFACDTATRGDLIIAFREKPPVAFRRVDAPINSFLPNLQAVRGHILGSRDFVGLLGTGQIVYTDFGSAKGAKPGDYLLVFRGYSEGDLNKIDRASERLPKGQEDTAVRPAKVRPDAEAAAPHRVLGELLVLDVTSASSTAVITRAISEMELGDAVQSEEASAATATGAAPETCRPASRLRRMLFPGHGCQSPKPAHAEDKP